MSMNQGPSANRCPRCGNMVSPMSTFCSCGQRLGSPQSQPPNNVDIQAAVAAELNRRAQKRWRVTGLVTVGLIVGYNGLSFLIRVSAWNSYYSALQKDRETPHTIWTPKSPWTTETPPMRFTPIRPDDPNFGSLREWPNSSDPLSSFRGNPHPQPWPAPHP